MTGLLEGCYPTYITVTKYLNMRSNFIRSKYNCAIYCGILAALVVMFTGYAGCQSMDNLQWLLQLIYVLWLL